MKTRVYYQVYNDSSPFGVAHGDFTTAELARTYIDGELERHLKIDNQENREYWTAYAKSLKISKVIELTEPV
jgi:hypothetical protein